MRYYEDPILGKGRAADVSGGTGSAEYVGGTRIAIGGETISFVNSATIQNVTGNSVTLEPDTAYKITATASAVTLNANVPEAGKWAYEGHAEIFVAGTGYIVTGANVVLANPLEPDAVNNCVLRFHDGTCIIDVEDHVYGYIVTSISGTTQGTLPYGITSTTSNYIAFDATTNGSVIDLSGSTANSEKHIVGNGYTETTLTGAVDCSTNKVTVANLALQDVVVNGGTMTIGDAYIPSGSTVAVSGGGLALEKVTGAGSASVIDLDGTNAFMPERNTASVSGCTFIRGSATYGGAINAFYGGITLVDCTISGNIAANGGGIFTGNGGLSIVSCLITGNTATTGNAYGGGGIRFGGTCTISDSIVSGNVQSNGKDVGVGGTPKGTLILSGGNTIGQIRFMRGENTTGEVVLVGSNKIDEILPSLTSANERVGTVTISSGASIDLTSSIAPGGGITVLEGGCTVNGIPISATGETPYSSIVNSGGTLYIDGEPAE